MLAFHGGVPGVGKQEAPRAVRILGAPRLKTALPKESRLLVACDAADGQGSPHAFKVAEHLTAGADLGEHSPGDVQKGKHLLIPLARVDVAKHGTGGVGSVGDEYPALRQLPDQPGVHRTRQDLALFGTLPCALHVIQDPLDLGAAEIGVKT